MLNASFVGHDPLDGADLRKSLAARNDCDTVVERGGCSFNHGRFGCKGSEMQGADTEIAELPPQRAAHIRNHFPKPFSDAPTGIDLPYGLLGGDGLERLCALLLIAEGQAPRYFGKSGVADYGVDVVVSDGANCVVYQCKNVATYRKGDLAGWL